MCFPDVYEIGMSNLGMMILYNLFNEREDVWCERVFSPWTDLDKVMRQENISLFALESQDPVKNFDFLGITLGYEMCYTNVLQVLDLSGIPLLASERKEVFALESQDPVKNFDFLGITLGYEMCYTNVLQVLDLSGIPLLASERKEDPIVIGGGACAYNPEPLAAFFDLFYIGEGETSYDALFDAYKKNQEAGGSREDFLMMAAQIPGIYVPAFYDVTYKEDGTFL